MPMPKSPLMYPAAYMAILERVVHGDTVRVQFETERKASYFCMRYGGFRRAVQRNANEDPMLAAQAMGIQIKRFGTVVAIGPMDTEPEVLAALERPVDAPTQENPDEYTPIPKRPFAEGE